MQSENKRRPWLPEDKQKLIRFWDQLGSIVLISIALDRPEGSVQTEASRLNLPPRYGDQSKHRKKWTDDEVSALEVAVRSCLEPTGQIRIIDVAERVSRSVDAVFSKLSEEYESREVLRQNLWVPPIEELANSNFALQFKPPSRDNTGRPDVKPTDPRKVPKLRLCLTCSTPFHSEGAHNRICKKCKSNDDASDW